MPDANQRDCISAVREPAKRFMLNFAVLLLSAVVHARPRLQSVATITAYSPTRLNAYSPKHR